MIFNVNEEQKPRVRALVAALRSDEFQQGSTYLTQYNLEGVRRDCCLGVACTIAMRLGLPLETARHERDWGAMISYREPGSSNGSSSALFGFVSSFFGFGEDVTSPVLNAPPHLRPRVEEASKSGWSPQTFNAIVANDDLKFTFGEIADCFEYTYLREDWDARQPAPAAGGAQ